MQCISVQNRFIKKRKYSNTILYNLRPKMDRIRLTLLHKIALPHIEIALSLTYSLTRSRSLSLYFFFSLSFSLSLYDEHIRARALTIIYRNFFLSLSLFAHALCMIAFVFTLFISYAILENTTCQTGNQLICVIVTK